MLQKMTSLKDKILADFKAKKEEVVVSSKKIIKKKEKQYGKKK